MPENVESKSKKTPQFRVIDKHEVSSVYMMISWIEIQPASTQFNDPYFISRVYEWILSFRLMDAR
jgi:hypothetical protein